MYLKDFENVRNQVLTKPNIATIEELIDHLFWFPLTDVCSKVIDYDSYYMWTLNVKLLIEEYKFCFVKHGYSILDKDAYGTRTYRYRTYFFFKSVLQRVHIG